MPETSEGIDFDELGICKACRSSEMKMRIDWAERERDLRRILEEAKSSSGENYDCLVPISGGKDSCFQLHVLCNVYGMKPLACTFSHNWWSETGKWNLQNVLERFNVDHVMFTPNRAIINKIARISLCAIGDSCWHCHAGVGAYPLQVAVQYRLPLIVWGESTAEFGSKSTYADPIPFDNEYYMKVSTKVAPDKMVRDGLTARDLYPFKIPSRDELNGLGIRGIHLGDYIFWDGERQVDFIKRHYGWREDKVEGAYKGYKSVECRMAGVHDYAKWVKRGFGRGTDQASIDVRNGIMTREEGLALAAKVDAARPGALDYYLEITGYTEDEFLEILEAQRKGQARELPILSQAIAPLTKRVLNREFLTMDPQDEKQRLYGTIDKDRIVADQKFIYQNAQFHFYRYFFPMPNFKGPYHSTDGEGFRNTLSSDRAGKDLTKNVHFFGGSTMWGVGAVTDNDTIPSVFSAKMNALSADTHFIVKNCGVGGYINAQEMIVLLERLGDEPIDCAIFVDGVNEAHMGWEEYAFNGNRGRFLMPSVHSGLPAVKYLISNFWCFKKPELMGWLLPDPESEKQPGDLDEDQVSQAKRVVSLYRKNKTIIDALGDKFGFRAFFFLQPNLFTKPNASPYEMKSPYWDRKRFVLFSNHMYDLFLDEFRDDGNFFDISRAIRTSDTVFLDDHHTNRRGNELIVDAILERLPRDLGHVS